MKFAKKQNGKTHFESLFDLYLKREVEKHGKIRNMSGKTLNETPANLKPIQYKENKLYQLIGLTFNVF